MTENVFITLIMGIVVLAGIALFLFKDRLGSARIRGSKNGVEMDMKARQSARSQVKGNVINGDQNTLTGKAGVQVNDNQVTGNNNKLGGN